MTMQVSVPLSREVVLIGGGHSHALLLRKWGMNPLPGARLTVINPGPTAPYSGMLPGHVAGHYSQDEMMIDLVRLARFAGARVIIDEAIGIDRVARRVKLRHAPSVAYDLASFDIGINALMPDLPGFAEHAVAAKPLDDYARAWEAFVTRAAQRNGPARVVVLGGGVAGVELALAMTHRLRGIGAAPDVTVLEAGPHPLPGLGAGARRALLAQLARAGVALRTDAVATHVTRHAVHLQTGEACAADFILGAAGARPHDWLTATDLPLMDGFIRVGPTLQVEGAPELFAAGDCAHLTHAPRPKAGVYAVRAAPILWRNIRAALGVGRMRIFRPQRDFLKLISLGGKSAVADKAGLRLEGPLLWRWKDRIDRKFMQKFHDLPAMPAPALPRHVAAGVTEAMGDKPLCGGCGAKVGAGALRAALSSLPAPVRTDVLTAPGDDAAVLRTGGVMQVATLDHLRAFTLDPAMQARISAVHALGDVWAMGARPQAVLANIVLPRMAERLQAEWLREIVEAAAPVFRAAGAEIVGGHSSVADELAIGFAVTGLAEGAVLHKGGAQPGDALVLTKPLGTGVLLAAEMAGAARGADVAAALASMSQAQDDWAAALARHAHAMTDITGFGLAGHLQEMAHASGCGAGVDLPALPVLPGAEALAAAGHRSSLWPANRAAVEIRGEGADSPRGQLLFDPQTAGGLLAAVPEERLETVLDELRAAGCAPAVVGRMQATPPRIRIRGGEGPGSAAQ